MKRMEPVEVSTKDGLVRLLQPVTDDDDDIVLLTPEQVPLVIKWLREAAKNAEGE
jgi:hypothetical protein